ncbi:hypothetical protein F4776DRAFT_19810 [Hypoxylon sp. NC0597]|nr:hypothetical protein F4776DRAFT_19810 [Hypoxylon sp. NC0597]
MPAYIHQEGNTTHQDVFQQSLVLPYQFLHELYSLADYSLFSFITMAIKLATFPIAGLQTLLGSNSVELGYNQARVDGDQLKLQATPYRFWAETYPEDFARAFVSKILSGAHGKVACGKLSTFISLITTYCPAWLIDCLSINNIGLDI